MGLCASSPDLVHAEGVTSAPLKAANQRSRWRWYCRLQPLAWAVEHVVVPQKKRRPLPPPRPWTGPWSRRSWGGHRH